MHKIVYGALLAVCVVAVVTHTYTPVGFNTSQFVATAQSASSYGEQLGETVYKSVNNIKAFIPQAQVTYADALALMATENMGLNATLCAGSNDCGLTQIIPGTYKGLLSGSMAGGTCTYVGQIQTKEGSSCASLDARGNPRCSVEMGACLLNYYIMQCDGNRSCAYSKYNAGPRGRAPAANINRFNKNYRTLSQGGAPSRSAIWNAMVTKVNTLSGGNLATNDAQRVLTSSWETATLSSQNDLNTIFTGLGNTNTTNSIARLLGVGSQSTSGSSGGGYTTNTSSSVSGDTTTSFQEDTGVLSAVDTIVADALEDISIAYSTPANQQTTDAALYCLPNVVTQEEPILLAWQCAQEVATSTNFTTKNSANGLIQTTATTTTAYTLTCGEVVRTCAVEVVAPQVALQAPETIARGDRANIYWSSLDTRACTLNSDADATFVRSGVRGDIETHTLYQNTEFTLVCETATGSVIQKSVTVSVR